MPLTPVNECGVPKFICTSLRPSLPPCPELYNLEPCAKFVSEFLTYEPLADPLHPPAHLPSPVSVLAWQTADAFDASMVLCSLLLGAGYNAFVVMGYAPLAVTLNDQTQVKCPLLAQQQQQQGPWWMHTASGPGTTAGSTNGPGTRGQGSTSSISSSAAGTAAGGGTSASGRDSDSSSKPGNVSSSGGDASSTSSGSRPAGGPAAAAGGADEPGKRKKYQIKPKPELLSKFLQQHQPEQPGFESQDGKALPDTAVASVDASMSQVKLVGTA